jgi:tetrahydromethanopterin S-methyltransferase subunit H
MEREFYLVNIGLGGKQVILKYESGQLTGSIGGRVFGGQPGQNPPLMITSMFAAGDKILQSRKQYKFDRNVARSQIERILELEAITGLPSLVDFVANSTEEIRGYIEMLLEITNESGLPFSSDMFLKKDKLKTAKYVASIGGLDRYLYNSLSFFETENLQEEIEAVAKIGVKHLLLALWDKNTELSEGRMRCLDKMLPLLEPYSFETILCDTTPLSLPASMIGNRAAELIKSKYGLLSGCGRNSGVLNWWRASGEMGGVDTYKSVDTAMEALGSMGADFVIYGPASSADRVYPAVAIAQCNLALQVMDEYKSLPENMDHPIYKMFPKAVKMYRDMIAGVKIKRRWLIKPQ